MKLHEKDIKERDRKNVKNNGKKWERTQRRNRKENGRRQTMEKTKEITTCFVVFPRDRGILILEGYERGCL
jgi:hypothetical protein